MPVYMNGSGARMMRQFPPTDARRSARDRSERIRTYNFPQGRVTDHRIGLTLHKIDAIMDGDLNEMMDTLATTDRMAKMQET